LGDAAATEVATDRRSDMGFLDDAEKLVADLADGDPAR